MKKAMEVNITNNKHLTKTVQHSHKNYCDKQNL